MRAGALVRADSLQGLTEAGWQALWEHGVRTVIDLRNADERAPDGRPEGITTVQAIADAPDGGVAFHCMSGRDRTGQIAMVLLMMLGASVDEVVQDYSESLCNLEERYRSLGVTDEGPLVAGYLADRGLTAPGLVRELAPQVLALLRDGGLPPATEDALRRRLT